MESKRTLSWPTWKYIPCRNLIIYFSARHRWYDIAIALKRLIGTRKIVPVHQRWGLRLLRIVWPALVGICPMLGARCLAQLEVASPRETGNQAIALPASAGPHSPPYPFILYHTYHSFNTIPRHTIPCLLVLIVLHNLPYSTIPYPIIPYYAIAIVLEVSSLPYHADINPATPYHTILNATSIAF